MTPAELMALADGDQENWNRICGLAAWIAMCIMNRIPTLSSEPDPLLKYKTIQSFLDAFPPPGYRPSKDDK